MSLMHDALREMEKMGPAAGSPKPTPTPTLTYDTSPSTREQGSSVGSVHQQAFVTNYAAAGAHGKAKRTTLTRGGWMAGAFLLLCLLTSWWIFVRPASTPAAAIETSSASAKLVITPAVTTPSSALAATPNTPTTVEATIPALAPPSMPASPTPAPITAPSLLVALQQPAPSPNVQALTNAMSPQAPADTATPPPSPPPPSPPPPPVIAAPSKPIAVASLGVQRAVLISDAATLRDAAARNATVANVNRRFNAIARAIEKGDDAEARTQLALLEQELPATSLTLLRAQAWVLSTGANADVSAVRAAYTAILARLPDDENALLNLSALELKAGKLDAARALVSSALTANPDSLAARTAQQRIGAATQIAQSVTQK